MRLRVRVLGAVDAAGGGENNADVGTTAAFVTSDNSLASGDVVLTLTLILAAVLLSLPLGLGLCTVDASIDAAKSMPCVASLSAVLAPSPMTAVIEATPCNAKYNTKNPYFVHPLF